MAADVLTSPDVPLGVRNAIESLVGELTKLADEHGDVVHPDARGTADALVGTGGGSGVGDDVAGTSLKGNGLVDISLTIQGKTFDVKLALPDNSTPKPLWGVQVTEGANTSPILQVLVQDGQNWRVELSPPLLPHTFKLDAAGTNTLTISALSASLVKGAPPTSFTFSS